MASRETGVASALLVALGLLLLAAPAQSARADVRVPRLGVAPEIDFGGVEVGETLTRTVTATSDGSAEVTIEAVGLSGGDLEQFAVVSDGCAGRTVPPGDTCDVIVAFRPSGEEESRAELAFSSDDPQGRRSVTLVGVGLSAQAPVPSLELSDERVDFGSVEVGDERTLDLTATSVGDSDVRVLGIELSADAPAFAVGEDGCTGRTLAPGDWCALSVAFRPIAAGEPRAVLHVVSDALEGPGAVELIGTSPSGPVEPGDPTGPADPTDPADPAAPADPADPADPGEPAAEEAVAVDDLPGSLAWVAAGLLAALATTGLARAARGRRSARWVREHVRIRPTPAPWAEVDAEGAGQGTSHAVRISPRASPGIQTVEEVP